MYMAMALVRSTGLLQFWPDLPDSTGFCWTDGAIFRSVWNARNQEISLSALHWKNPAATVSKPALNGASHTTPGRERKLSRKHFAFRSNFSLLSFLYMYISYRDTEKRIQKPGTFFYFYLKITCQTRLPVTKPALSVMSLCDPIVDQTPITTARTWRHYLPLPPAIQESRSQFSNQPYIIHYVFRNFLFYSPQISM